MENFWVNRLQGVMVTLVYSLIFSLILYKLIDLTVGSKEIEIKGLDIAIHGEENEEKIND